MGRVKKITAWMFAFCLLVLCFAMTAFAADGEIFFTDPQTETGKEVEVKAVIKRSRGTVGKIEIVMKYDDGLLRFKDGENVTESEGGILTYSLSTAGNADRKEFLMHFDALKAGTATVKIQKATILNSGGSALDYIEGSSTITIAQGSGAPAGNTGEYKVEVNGKKYRISDELPGTGLPKGYEASTLEYDMETYNVLHSDATGLYLAYLVDESNAGRFFMYVEDNAAFAPFVQVAISDEVTITFLPDITGITLPDTYRKTEVVLDEQVFPAWQSKEDPNICIIYAINNSGVKSLYRLDNEEGTYQRFQAPKAEGKQSTWLSTVSGIIGNHLDQVVLMAGLAFLMLIVIIVVLSVKLYNRNAELDEVYEEYGIDDDKEEAGDDIILDLDEDKYLKENTGAGEVETYGQTALNKVFSEKNAKEEPGDKDKDAYRTPADEEHTLGKALENQKVQGQGTEIYEDDDPFKNLTIDFIDPEEDE